MSDQYAAPAPYPSAPSASASAPREPAQEADPAVQVEIPVGQPVGFMLPTGNGVNMNNPIYFIFRCWIRLTYSQCVGTVAGALIAWYWAAYILVIEGIFSILYAIAAACMIRSGAQPRWLLATASFLAAAQGCFAFVAVQYLSDLAGSASSGQAEGPSAEKEAKIAVLAFAGFCISGAAVIALNAYAYRSGELVRSVRELLMDGTQYGLLGAGGDYEQQPPVAIPIGMT